MVHGKRLNLNVQRKLGQPPECGCREKPRKILVTLDGAIPSFRYPAPSEVLMLRTVLLIVLVLALIGSLPMWPYSAGWGYYPTGGLGAVLLILVVLMLMDRRAV